MDLITLDFETYYSKAYSLRKMTTEAYVRHELFEVICVAVKRNNEDTKTYWGDRLIIAAALALYDIPNNALLCHHAAFDGFILSHHYGIKPKFWFDTLSMARPLHNMTVGCSLKALAIEYGIGEKGTEVMDAQDIHQDQFTELSKYAYMEYCAKDVDLTFKLFHKLRKNYHISELEVIDLTIRMFTEPHIIVDDVVLTRHLENIAVRRERLLSKLGGDKAKTILNSNPKFAALLEKLGAEVPMKTSLTTGKQTYAFAKTDQEFLALLEHPNPNVCAVVEARLGTKSSIEQTRTNALLGVSKRGALPIMLNYYGAHTGRFSGGDGMNLQNLPSRGNNVIRTALCAPMGYRLAVSDSAQIEARMVAWLAGQDDLVDAFRRGRDVYCEFASEVFGRKITKSDTTERFVGKTCILGLGYGMGPDKFRATLALGGVDIDLAEASRIVQLYRSRYFKIPALWKKVDRAIRNIAIGGSGIIENIVAYNHEGFTLPNGMIIRYPGLREVSDGSLMYANQRNVYANLAFDPSAIYKGTKIYGGKAVENIVQALARIVITDQMLAIKKKHNYPVLFQVHDELIFLVRDIKNGEAEYHLRNILIEMAKPPLWAPDIPVACEGSLGYNYGET